MYERKDHFYQKAKKEGLASRAAYKLLEIQKKFKIWKSGDSILDLGCAPGGWLQILSKEVGPKGRIVGIDRLPLKIAVPLNVIFIQRDFEEGFDFDASFDAILSDLSPDLSGIPFRDTYRSYELALLVWRQAQKRLKKRGHMVIKMFPGAESEKFKRELKKHFERIATFIPEATRKTSSEIYLIGLALRAR